MQRHHLRDGLSEQSHDCFLLSPDDSNIIVEGHVCNPWSGVGGPTSRMLMMLILLVASLKTVLALVLWMCPSLCEGKVI